jgi:hypothetical protein
MALGSSALVGCLGDIATSPGKGSDDPKADDDPSGTPDPSNPAAPAGPGSSAFDVTSDQPQLLPFGVRLRRLAAVVGVPETDAVFELVRQNRTGLGDHDFANGQQPDRLWTANRMSLWVRSLKPVCASAAFKAKYPSLPGSLGALVEAAYGRAATADDRAAIDEALAAASGLDEGTRNQTICLAILSAAEFVIQ